MWRVAATSDQAERSAREVERGSREYWLLRYLETLPSDTKLSAVITRPEERRTVLELEDFVYNASITPRPGHKPGRKLEVMIENVDPRQRKLFLREI